MIELPASAILEKEGKSFVWIVDPAKLTVSPRPVATAARPNGLVGLTNGVQEGERVVTAGVHSLTDGQSVTIGGDE